jgi:serine/threonine protein kinase/formylglycine-generating enzyme required for sulfatase activity
MENLIGKTLDNAYRIDQLLGKGGMGAVYRARDVALERDVAIKVMHPHFTDDETFRARFLQEARAIAALGHPGIVQVYAFGQDLGLLYIVMDFVPGQTLYAWLQRLAAEHKIVVLDESLEIVRQVALALHYAHEKGILHRDVKPSNILLKPADPALAEPGDLAFQPVLTDFGLAKLAEGGVQTHTGTAMGTPDYMSPEQCLGVDPDRRSDVYSLSVVFYELCTGQVPFETRSLTEAIRRHTQEPPPPPRSINPDLPVEVENLILRGLAKRPEARFATAREMADALRALRTGMSSDRTAVPAPSAQESLATRISETDRVAEPTAVSQPRPAGSRVEVALETPDLAVTPGDQTTASVVVLNRGASLATLWVSIEGIPMDWVPVLPPALQVLPGASQTFKLAIQPPLSLQARVGRYHLTIRISSQDGRGQDATVSGTLFVAPAIRFRCALQPPEVRAGRAAQVVLENQGNAAQGFTIEFQEPAGELVFEPSRTQVTVAPGQTASVPFRAAPRQSRWLGGPRTHPFVGAVRASTGDAQIVNGQVMSAGVFPIWALLAVLVACLVIGVVGAALIAPEVLARLTPTAAMPTEASLTVTSASIVLTPVALSTPTFTPTPTGMPTATISPAPEDTPTLTPTPAYPGMIDVPAGEFLRGSTQAQIQAAVDECTQQDSLCSIQGLQDELPQRTVYVDAFHLDAHEVTNADYAGCVDAGACEAPLPVSSNQRDPYYGDASYADYPVVYVRWSDADAYCRWAGKRLPTEAEWEKAARGPDGLLWPWGNVFDANRANYRKPGVPPDGSDTERVGSHPGGASPYGAADMVGNVWEWVADWYAPSYEGQPVVGNPTGPASGDKRVIRGGSWNSNIASARAASRAGASPDERYFDIGFRCAE